MNNLFVVGAALAALVIAYNVWGAAKVQQGIQQERASVSKEAGKRSANAQAARRAVTPSNAHSVLSNDFRD